MIVERFKSDPELGFDEWAALAFLTERSFEPPIAPRFLGGDADARVFVMEDLGPGRTLMTDRVAYRLPLGPLGRLADRLLVRSQLTHAFAERHRRTRDLLEARAREAAGAT